MSFFVCSHISRSEFTVYGKIYLVMSLYMEELQVCLGEKEICEFLYSKNIYFFVHCIIYFSLSFKKNNSHVFSSIIFLIIFASFIANNRIAFFLLISFVLITIFTLKTFRKNLIAVLFFMLPLFYYFYHNDTQINRKFVGFFLNVSSYYFKFGR